MKFAGRVKREDEMKLKLAVVVAVLLSSGTLKADPLLNWSFSFTTPDKSYVGEGSLQTMSLADSFKVENNIESGYLITSLTGEMNGSPMGFTPSFAEAIDNNYPNTFSPFLYHSFSFTVNGVDYFIHDNDSGAPPYGNALYGPNLAESVQLTLVDPIDTPEPSSLLLLLSGLALLGLKVKHTGK